MKTVKLRAFLFPDQTDFLIFYIDSPNLPSVFTNIVLLTQTCNYCHIIYYLNPYTVLIILSGDSLIKKKQVILPGSVSYHEITYDKLFSKKNKVK